MHLFEVNVFLDQYGSFLKLYLMKQQQRVIGNIKFPKSPSSVGFGLQELEDRKQITSGLQVQTIVGEENNDLLDYLRSLTPDKVRLLCMLDDLC
jgi:hypothetical protein